MDSQSSFQSSVFRTQNIQLHCNIVFMICRT